MDEFWWKSAARTHARVHREPERHNVGDQRTFDVKYPGDCRTSDWRQTLTYTVKVQAIKQKSLPRAK